MVDGDVERQQPARAVLAAAAVAAVVQGRQVAAEAAVAQQALPRRRAAERVRDVAGARARARVHAPTLPTVAGEAGG